MKRLLAALLLMPLAAFAQTVLGTVRLGWTLPTTTVHGLPLTGANALTSIQVYLSTSPIADTSTMSPTVTLSGTPTASTQTMQVASGSTIYARFRACTAANCSDFSAQVSKPVQLSTKPNVPTSVTIELEIS